MSAKEQRTAKSARLAASNLDKYIRKNWVNTFIKLDKYISAKKDPTPKSARLAASNFYHTHPTALHCCIQTCFFKTKTRDFLYLKNAACARFDLGFLWISLTYFFCSRCRYAIIWSLIVIWNPEFIFVQCHSLQVRNNLFGGNIKRKCQ